MKSLLSPVSIYRLLVILALLFNSNCFGQFKKGAYRQRNGSDFVYLYINANNKFKFSDTRNSSCWNWNTYEGNWKLQKDTLILSFDHAYITLEDTITWRTTNVSYVEIKRFLALKNKLHFIDATGMDVASNWGNFKLHDK